MVLGIEKISSVLVRVEVINTPFTIIGLTLSHESQLLWLKKTTPNCIIYNLTWYQSVHLTLKYSMSFGV